MMEGSPRDRPMAITTSAIRNLCQAEEAHAGHRADRIAELCQQLDAGEYAGITGVQLACEAIKWHRIRQDAYTMPEALQMMGVAA
jgi:hypothetical protein